MSGIKYTQLEKEIAYALNPEAWRSYSGYSAFHKRQIDHDRNAALAEARSIVLRGFAGQPPVTIVMGVLVPTTNTIHQTVMAGLKVAQEAVNKRQTWIDNRRKQQVKLDELATQLVSTYNKELTHNNISKIEKLAKDIERVAKAGCYDV